MPKPTNDSFLNRCDALIAKADAVLAERIPQRPGIALVSTLKAGPFAEWQSQSLSFLTSILGADHVYTTNFTSNVKIARNSDVNTGAGVLRAVRQDIENGYLGSLTALIAAEVFADFMEMAEHLLYAGYKDPAASLAGAVLEDGLRRIATTEGLRVGQRDDLSALNSRIAQHGTYNRLVQKKVAVWTDIRNNADHGKFGEYAADDVAQLISGVTDFLATYLDRA